MKKKPCPNCERMETVLKVIRTWASYYHDNFWTFNNSITPGLNHMKNLLNIANKCDEVLNGKKENGMAKSSHKIFAK